MCKAPFSLSAGIHYISEVCELLSCALHCLWTQLFLAQMMNWLTPPPLPFGPDHSVGYRGWGVFPLAGHHLAGTPVIRQEYSERRCRHGIATLLELASQWEHRAPGASWVAGVPK